MMWAGILAGIVSTFTAWLGQKWAQTFRNTNLKNPWILPVALGNIAAFMACLSNVTDSPIVYFSIALFACLAFIAATDIICGLIPNAANSTLAILGFIWTFGLAQQSSLFWILGLIFGGGLLWVVRIAFKRVRGIQGLGFGDVKLMAAGGGLLGPLYIGHALAFGAGVTLIWLLVFQKQALTNSTTKIPFGPGLCFGIATFWVYQVQGGIYGS